MYLGLIPRKSHHFECFCHSEGGQRPTEESSANHHSKHSEESNRVQKDLTRSLLSLKMTTKSYSNSFVSKTLLYHCEVLAAESKVLTLDSAYPTSRLKQAYQRYPTLAV